MPVKITQQSTVKIQ